MIDEDARATRAARRASDERSSVALVREAEHREREHRGDRDQRAAARRANADDRLARLERRPAGATARLIASRLRSQTRPRRDARGVDHHVDRRAVAALDEGLVDLVRDGVGDGDRRRGDQRARAAARPCAARATRGSRAARTRSRGRSCGRSGPARRARTRGRADADRKKISAISASGGAHGRASIRVPRSLNLRHACLPSPPNPRTRCVRCASSPAVRRVGAGPDRRDRPPPRHPGAVPRGTVRDAAPRRDPAEPARREGRLLVRALAVGGDGARGGRAARGRAVGADAADDGDLGRGDRARCARCWRRRRSPRWRSARRRRAARRCTTYSRTGRFHPTSKAQMG